MKKPLTGWVGAFRLLAAAIPLSATMPALAAPTSYKTATVDGLQLFYREAGKPSNPTIILLHGFPSSSSEFRELIPLLGDHFHVLAPDYPGMGFSQTPPPDGLRPTFDNLAVTMSHLLAQLGQTHFILYMHDFGGPVGMRIATQNPRAIDGLIFQNTTISLAGYNPARLKVFERIGGEETPEKLAEAEESASEQRDVFLHRTGAYDAAALDPDNWGNDAYAFGIPESRQFMARLLMNIGANIDRYDDWARFLKTARPKTLVVWGKNDPVFVPAATEAIKTDVPDAEVRYYDGGHFVLDEFSTEIAGAIRKSFAR